MDTLTHPAGEGTVANVIAQLIHARVPHWPVRVGNLSWIAEDPADRRGVVVATGQIGSIRHPPAGPTLIGIRDDDTEIRIIFPVVVSPSGADGALAALTAMGMLPARPSAAATAGAVPPIGRGNAGNSAELFSKEEIA